MSKGIDVSNYQGTIDWNKVKADGVEFVIIRAGWGKNGRDPKFKTYIDGALKVGLNVGVYWFLYAKNEKDIIANANSCVSVIGAYKDKINMKVWADWEYDSDNYCKGLTKATRTKWVKLFCSEVAKKGFEVGIYANPDYLKNKFNDISEYPLWLAYYTTNKGKYNPLIWQYSSKGKVKGINGNVDMDEFYGQVTTKPIEQIAINKNPYKEPTVLVLYSPKVYSENTKWVQWALNNKGNYGLKVDGYFGDLTLEVVKDFQKKNGLVVDGKVGQKTRKALR